MVGPLRRWFSVKLGVRLPRRLLRLHWPWIRTDEAAAEVFMEQSQLTLFNKCLSLKTPRDGQRLGLPDLRVPEGCRKFPWSSDNEVM